MISVQKIYLDAKGGGRLYIPQEIMDKLSWKHHERIVLVQDGEQLCVLLETDYQHEVHA